MTADGDDCGQRPGLDPAGRRRRVRVLLVEDEVDLAESLRRGLTNEGFVADVANDGITGTWLARENPYDVVVLDLMLPGKNGYAILEEMRAAENWTPVLMLTAKDGE